MEHPVSKSASSFVIPPPPTVKPALTLVPMPPQGPPPLPSWAQAAGTAPKAPTSTQPAQKPRARGWASIGNSLASVAKRNPPTEPKLTILARLTSATDALRSDADKAQPTISAVDFAALPGVVEALLGQVARLTEKIGKTSMKAPPISQPSAAPSMPRAATEPMRLLAAQLAPHQPSIVPVLTDRLAWIAARANGVQVSFYVSDIVATYYGCAMWQIIKNVVLTRVHKGGSKGGPSIYEVKPEYRAALGIKEGK